MTAEELECEKYICFVRDRELSEIATNIDKALVSQQFEELRQLRWMYEELQLMYSMAIETFRNNSAFRERAVTLHKKHGENLKSFDDIANWLASL